MSGDRECFTTINKDREWIVLAGDNYIYSEGIGNLNIITDYAKFN